MKSVVPAVARAASVVVVFRGVGADLFGVYSLAVAAVSLLSVTQGGIGAGVIRSVASGSTGVEDGFSRESELARALGGGVLLAAAAALLLFMLVAALVWAGLGVISVPQSYAAAGVPILALVALSGSINLLSGPFMALYEGLERFDISARLVATRSVLGAASDIAIVFLGGSLVVLLLGRIVIDAATLVLSTRTEKLLGERIRPALDRPRAKLLDRLKRIGEYGMNLTIAGVFGSLMWRGTYFVVGRYLGPGATGIYSLINELAIRAQQLVATGSEFLFPVTTRALRTDRREDLLHLLAATYAVAGVIGWPLVVMAAIFAPALLSAVATGSHVPAQEAFLRYGSWILILAYYVHGLSGIEHAVVNGSGRSDLNRNFNIVLSVTVMSAAVAGVFVFGSLGVLLGGVVLGVASALFILFVSRTVCVRPFSFFLPVAEIGGVSTVLGIGGAIIWGRYGSGLMSLAVVGVSVLLASYGLAWNRGFFGSLLYYTRLRPEGLPVPRL